MKPVNYFDLLGIDSEATAGEIKKAYRRLVFKYHPDHNKTKTAQKKFSLITKAYQVLTDPVKKEEYVKGQATAIADEPLKMLNSYWEIIYKKGFQHSDPVSGCSSKPILMHLK